MAKPPSLLDDAAFGDIGKTKASRRAVGSRPQSLKSVLAVACLLAACGSLAWYYWPAGRPPSATTGGAGSLSAQDQEAARRQAQKAAEDLRNPEVVKGSS